MSQDLPAPPPPADGPPPWPGPPAVPGASPPVGYPGFGSVEPARTADTAIWALVCAIASWFVCQGILAVVAIVLAHSARRTIRESGGARTGDGMVTAAQVIAWAQLAVLGVLLLFGLAVLVGVAVGAR